MVEFVFPSKLIVLKQFRAQALLCFWLGIKPKMSPKKRPAAKEVARTEDEQIRKRQNKKGPEQVETQKDEAKKKAGQVAGSTAVETPKHENEKDNANQLLVSAPETPRLETQPLQSLTATQLVQHDRFTTALQKFKEGHLTENEFLGMWSAQQRQGFCKMMETHRKNNQIEGWDDLAGQGSKKKKQKLLLQFLSTGKLDQAQVSQEIQGVNSMAMKKSNEWMSWNKIVQEYGEDEAKLRVRKGLIKTRKDPEAKAMGITIHQFLKVTDKTDFKQGIQQATSTSRRGKASSEQVAVMGTALLDGAEEPDILNDLWLGKKPGGDWKQTWQQLEIPETQPDPEEESEEEDVLAKLGLASPGSKKPKKKTKDDTKNGTGSQKG